MPLETMHIIKDCYWVNVSGTPVANSVWVNESDQPSTLQNGLYKSITKNPLDANDALYIRNQVGTFSGYNKHNSNNYTFRVQHNNIVPEQIQISMRGACPSGITTGMKANFMINGKELASDYPDMVGDWTTTSPTTVTKVYSVTSDMNRAILGGRIDDHYDYISMVLSYPLGHFAGFNTKDFKVYGIEVAYSGVNSWDNYDTTNPNSAPSYYYPDKITTRGQTIWVSHSGTPVASSDYFYINQPASGLDTDNSYIKHESFQRSFKKTHDNWDYNHDGTLGGNSVPFTYTQANTMPSGGIIFHYSPNLPVNHHVERARLTLRASLPPSSLYDNIRDAWEVEGYNPSVREVSDTYFKYPPGLSYNTSQSKRRDGYVLYGAGDIISNSGFVNQTVELNFLEPGLLGSTYNIASIKHRNVDIFEDIQLHFKGFPSGTCISTAELVLDTYDPQSRTEFFISGKTQNKVDTVPPFSGVVTSWGGDIIYGNYDETKMFNVGFFKFPELSGATTTAIQPAVYGDLLGDTSNQWYNVYRRRGPAGSTNSFNTLVIPHSGGGGIDFADRLDIGSDDFTLYFEVSSSGSNFNDSSEGTLYWRGDKTVYPTTHELSVSFSKTNDLDISILRNDTFYETLTITDSTFSTLFKNDIFISYLDSGASGQLHVWVNPNPQLTTFDVQASTPYFTRGSVPGAVTLLGNNPDVPTVSENNNLMIHQFGVSNSGMYNFNYLNRPEARSFVESRSDLARFLQGEGDTSVEWKVPYGSGNDVTAAKKQFNLTYTPLKNYEGIHSLSGPVKTSYNRLDVVPSSIYITGTVDINTDHPSGLQIRSDFRHISGSNTTYRLWESDDLFLPSGLNQTFTLSLAREKNHDKYQNTRYSDVTGMITTFYQEFIDLAPTSQFYGEVNLKSFNVVFDNWYIPSTGNNAITLYASGSPANPSQTMDLYLHHNTQPGNLDLFVEGHLPHSGLTTLYTIAGAKVDAMTLFLENLWQRETGNSILYTSGMTWPYHSGNLNFFTYSTTNSGIRDSMPLFAGTPENRAIPEYAMNLYLHSEGLETGSMNLVLYNDNIVDSGVSLYLANSYTALNSGVSLLIGKPLNADGSQGLDNEIPLYIARDSESTSHIVPLYLKAGEQSTNNVNMYVSGASGASQTFTVYVSGGHTPNNNFKLYTHGF